MTHCYTGDRPNPQISNVSWTWIKWCRCSHMFHPPPHPLPPEVEQLNSAFWEKHRNSRISIYLHSLSSATGQLVASFLSLHRLPTVWALNVYSMCSNYNWQHGLVAADWGRKKSSVFNKVFNSLFIRPNRQLHLAWMCKHNTATHLSEASYSE